MQQKLMALAVAALASGAAFAQSNVTIYGTIDVGFSHLKEHQNKGVKNKNAINAGQSADSLIGFKGVEDLGNGNKALFVLEAGFQNDTGKQNGDFLAEQAFLGLSGGWGTAIAGRLIAPRHGFLSAMDPFSAGTLGSYHNVFSDLNLRRLKANPGVTPNVSAEASLADIHRVSNAVAYVSPSFGGFNITAAYATNGVGSEISKKNDAKVCTVLPRYANGPLDVGVVYQQVKMDEAVTGVAKTDVKLKQWTAGAAYDFGVAKVSAFYDSFKIDAGNTAHTVYGIDGLKLKSWLLGVTMPYGKHSLRASYTQSKLNAAAFDGDAKARQWALGYGYSLSKRTSLYAAYADVKNDKTHGYRRAAFLSDSTNDYGDAARGGYQKGFQFGLKHDF
ncbi:MAG: porin [Zoogloeaceae bacterium]|nr:porin [Zoogloeaceae bacterium]